MATAPSGTVWKTMTLMNITAGSGLYVSVSNSANSSTCTVTAQVWFKTTGSSGGSGKVWFDWEKTLPTTVRVASKTYDAASETLMYTITKTYTKQTTAKTYNCCGTVTNTSATTVPEDDYYLVNVSYTIPALQSYAITYNANNGTGAPGSQTKYYGINLTLSSNIPTRSKYRFTEWNTKQDGSGTSYNSGATYSANGAVTLYAQWEYVHQGITMSNVSVYRSNASGTLTDDGSYAHFGFNWSADRTVYTDNVGVSYKISYKKTTDTSYTDLYTGTLSEASGTVSYTSTTAPFDTNYTYDIKIATTDNYTTTSTTTFISPAYFIMDFKDGGHGIAFGAPALEDKFKVAMPTEFTNSVVVDTSLASATTPSSNQYENGFYIYSTPNATASGTGYGNWGYMRATKQTSGSQGLQLETRRYVNSAWVYNTVNLLIDGSGNRLVGVSDAGAWRNALGASSGVWPRSVGGLGTAQFHSLFSVSSHTIKTSGSMSVGPTNGTTSITKSGYYPLGIIGWSDASSSNTTLKKAYLSAQGNGTGTITWTIFNSSSASLLGNVVVYVLWCVY